MGEKRSSLAWESMTKEELEELIKYATTELRHKERETEEKLEDAFMKALSDLRKAGCYVRVTAEGIDEDICLDEYVIINFDW